MMNKSDYLRNALVNHTLRGVAYTPPSALYLALFNVTPTSSGGGTEVSGGGYLRRVVTFAAPTAGSTSNVSTVTFPTPTLDWGNVLGVAVYDALSAGNMLYFGNLGTPKTVYAGEEFYFPSGYFQIDET